ncbi:MAG: arginine N-succinyltransferase [Alphaproteobacteria bacterium]|nr:arginine N-succinyltransferase [Alphaproteobacteria bacterium]
MQNQSQNTPTKPKGSRQGCLKALGIVVLGSVLTAVLVVLGIKIFLFPGEFKPVELTTSEEVVLEEKLAVIKPAYERPVPNSTEELQSPLEPRAYSEIGAIREVSFTEREVNALLADNTEYATHLAIDFEPNLASARLRIPVDQDVPMLGGKTIRASAGMELRYAEGRPVVILKGVSLWGIPVPNAWLGNMKNIDLVREFEGEEGFWKSFSEGIEHISVENEKITIKFKE